MAYSDVIFDLDNTLYPSTVGIAQLIDERIIVYLQNRLGLDYYAAKNMSEAYQKSHGLAVRGLKNDYDIDVHEFLEFAHDLDYEKFISPNPGLSKLLGNIELRKNIFTNSPSIHANKVLSILGIACHFDHIFDLDFLELQPKPLLEGYRRVISALNCNPQDVIFVDDNVNNLIPAYNLGMTTIWIGQNTKKDIIFGASYSVPTIKKAISLIKQLSKSV
jgi:putative hydrolase of the HAD superfamily